MNSGQAPLDPVKLGLRIGGFVDFGAKVEKLKTPNPLQHPQWFKQ